MTDLSDHDLQAAWDRSRRKISEWCSSAEFNELLHHPSREALAERPPDSTLYSIVPGTSSATGCYYKIIYRSELPEYFEVIDRSEELFAESMRRGLIE